MELKEAKQIITQAINAATLKGCYNIEDIKLIIQALDRINNQPDVEFGSVEKLDMRTAPIMAAE